MMPPDLPDKIILLLHHIKYSAGTILRLSDDRDSYTGPNGDLVTCSSLVRNNWLKHYGPVPEGQLDLAMRNNNKEPEACDEEQG